MYHLIADSGSSKTDWTLIDIEAKEIIYSFTSEGYNPFFWNQTDLIEAFQKDEKQITTICSSSAISNLYFYGAGCGTKEQQFYLKSLLKKVFSTAKVSVKGDLLGAARSLLGKENGIAGILGTGANSCLYRNNKIIDQPVSLGYLLSDFGSGATIGLEFLKLLLTNQLSIITTNNFIDQFNLSTEDILQKLYKEEAPNKFCASFAPFINKHVNIDDVIFEMVTLQFQKYIEYYILPLKHNKHTNIELTGSIAFHFAPIIKGVFSKNNLSINKITATPSAGLIEFHLK
ncbi:hypothetical protein EI427_20430 [Flammeovirga pectinis]|uniref:ATPase n=1 Tax=Flammeovirga pectinis TaxID=2494373 RepID=A0A3S9P8F5_9BACT|nr:hypothetical protein [Flammeovirga pectinis]AZQ64491.1 hypothetical protein EI427_20430 [Flammeovirga pectinis]